MVNQFYELYERVRANNKATTPDGSDGLAAAPAVFQLALGDDDEEEDEEIPGVPSSAPQQSETANKKARLE